MYFSSCTQRSTRTGTSDGFKLACVSAASGATLSSAGAGMRLSPCCVAACVLALIIRPLAVGIMHAQGFSGVGCVQITVAWPLCSLTLWSAHALAVGQILQGFEVYIQNQVFFAFSKYEDVPNSDKKFIYCGQTFDGELCAVPRACPSTPHKKRGGEAEGREGVVSGHMRLPCIATEWVSVCVQCDFCRMRAARSFRCRAYVQRFKRENRRQRDSWHQPTVRALERRLLPPPPPPP